MIAALMVLALSGCTSGSDDDQPDVALPSRSGEPGILAGDSCAALLPSRVLAVLERFGARSDGNPRAVLVPLRPPGATKLTPTQGCEVRLDKAPLEGVVVRRTDEAGVIGKLRTAIRKSTEEATGVPGWDLRWSDAASTIFAFRAGDTAPEVLIVQLVAQQPQVDRKRLVLALTRTITAGIN